MRTFISNSVNTSLNTSMKEKFLSTIGSTDDEICAENTDSEEVSDVYYNPHSTNFRVSISLLVHI